MEREGERDHSASDGGGRALLSAHPPPAKALAARLNIVLLICAEAVDIGPRTLGGAAIGGTGNGRYEHPSATVSVAKTDDPNCALVEADKKC